MVIKTLLLSGLILYLFLPFVDNARYYRSARYRYKYGSGGSLESGGMIGLIVGIIVTIFVVVVVIVIIKIKCAATTTVKPNIIRSDNTVPSVSYQPPPQGYPPPVYGGYSGINPAYPPPVYPSQPQGYHPFAYETKQ